MRLFTAAILALISQSFLTSQITDSKATEVWEPVPRVVAFDNHEVPSDAIVLFDGASMDAWQHGDGAEVKWTVEDGILTVKPGTGAIFTKESFGDCQLHIEWRAPQEVVGEGQGRGNSGVFLQNRYEVQILDSYENRTYSNGQTGALYKQHIPLVNAMKPVAEWETFDIIFKAPQFNDDGIKVSSGRLTVLHNGVLIQNHVEIQGAVTNVGLPKDMAHGDAPFHLQDHFNPVSFRNIWLRRL